MEETEQAFSKDIVTTMRVIFTHQAGPNLRNEIAHGMLRSDACSSAAAIYGWWVIMNLALHPVASLVIESERLEEPESK